MQVSLTSHFNLSTVTLMLFHLIQYIVLYSWRSNKCLLSSEFWVILDLSLKIAWRFAYYWHCTFYVSRFVGLWGWDEQRNPTIMNPVVQCNNRKRTNSTGRRGFLQMTNPVNTTAKSQQTGGVVCTVVIRHERISHRCTTVTLLVLLNTFPRVNWIISIIIYAFGATYYLFLIWIGMVQSISVLDWVNCFNFLDDLCA